MGAGGNGGGGAGAPTTGNNGTANTGGGAGGTQFGGTPGTGGSGIVIISYDTPGTSLDEVSIIQSEDGVLPNEDGIATFGSPDGRTITERNTVIKGLLNLPVNDLASGGDIGTAADTVDIYQSFEINQTTAAQTITFPDPTDTTARKFIYVDNVGSTSFTALGATVLTGAGITAKWNGSAWSLH
jgi:hypothetical protein